MTNLEIRNQKIIDAVIEKAKALCPDSLALIGIYGSFLTGDIHEKSDLDLLILINDDNGWQLATGFIQDDLAVGHDIYCTNWDSLEYDAKFETAGNCVIKTDISVNNGADVSITLADSNGNTVETKTVTVK